MDTQASNTPPSHDTTTSGPVGQAKAWWTVAYLTCCALVAYTSMLSLNLLVDPIKADLAIDDVRFSLLQGAAFVVPVTISGILFGFLADRTSRRLLLAIGLTAWGLATIACGFAKSYPALVIARGFLGFGKGALVPVAVTMVAQSFPAKQRGRALGVFFVGVSIGPGIGLWSAGLAYDAVQAAFQGGTSWPAGIAAWRLVFFAVGLPALVLLPFVIWIHDPRASGSTINDEQQTTDRSHLTGTGLLFATIFFGYILVSFSDAAAVAWIPAVFSREFGFSVAAAGGTFGLVAISGGTIGPLLGGGLSDRVYGKYGARGRLAMCSVGALVLSVLFLSFLFGRPYPLIAALIGAAILITGIGSVGMVVVQEFLPNKLRGLGTGITYSFGLLLAGNGPTAVALVTERLYSIEHTGRAVATICSPAALLASLLLLLGVRLSSRRSPTATADASDQPAESTG